MFETTTPDGAKALLDSGEGWIYLDVRTVEEFASGHPPDAHNVPLAFADPGRGMVMNERFVAVVKKLFPADARLVVGCAAGGRSAKACQILAAEGYAKLANMHGGFGGAPDQAGWASCGLPVERECPPERSWAGLRE
jgi:rhodanese-related sulfurtransferase